MVYSTFEIPKKERKINFDTRFVKIGLVVFKLLTISHTPPAGILYINIDRLDVWHVLAS